MKILIILVALTSFNTFSIEKENVIKNFSHRFTAYTVAPGDELDEQEKQRRIRNKVTSSKSEILRRAQKTCSKYENTSGWEIKTWEVNDLGWLSGEGEVQASFSCVIRKSTGECQGLRCSLGCQVFGGRCCIDKLCPIY